MSNERSTNSCQVKKVKGREPEALVSVAGKAIFACSACKMDNVTISSPEHGVFAPLETN